MAFAVVVRVACSVTLLLVTGCGRAAQNEAAPPDLVLATVTVIDGLGNSPNAARIVEIRGGRIKAIRGVEPGEPTEGLSAATHAGARALGRQDVLGSVETGKIADLASRGAAAKRAAIIRPTSHLDDDPLRWLSTRLVHDRCPPGRGWHG